MQKKNQTKIHTQPMHGVNHGRTATDSDSAIVLKVTKKKTKKFIDRNAHRLLAITSTTKQEFAKENI